MLSYVMVGTNDLRKSGIFYNAILLPLGYEVINRRHQLIYSLPGTPDQNNGPGAFYVTEPFDGQPATVGNGTMFAFRTERQRIVRDLHKAGVDSGGTDEGAPGFRADYGERFYVAYLRDPDRNKIALFCTNPKEPKRGD
jgi:catechol 2,3-dioxygenase-like lactoylglutathione lyase family enzyme